MRKILLITLTLLLIFTITTKAETTEQPNITFENTNPNYTINDQILEDSSTICDVIDVINDDIFILTYEADPIETKPIETKQDFDMLDIDSFSTDGTIDEEKLYAELEKQYDNWIKQLQTELAKEFDENTLNKIIKYYQSKEFKDPIINGLIQTKMNLQNYQDTKYKMAVNSIIKSTEARNISTQQAIYDYLKTSMIDVLEYNSNFLEND